MTQHQLLIQLPEWVDDVVRTSPETFPDNVARMDFVIALARQNIEHKTGGPFGAAVFDHFGRLIAPGVNIVIPSNCSLLHAEMTAIALAQKALGRFDLSNQGQEDIHLVTSVAPCAMCFGAIPWSGVSHVVCGARGEDAESIGFDEGPKPDDWITPLNQRGITVIQDVRRDAALQILRDYAKNGGIIYSVKHPSPAAYPPESES